MLKKRNRKLTRQSVDFILAFCDELRRETERADLGKDIWEKVDKAYITRTMLSGIYNILINEGYTKKHLDNFFFFEGEPDKNREMTEKANSFYFPGQSKRSKIVEDFFQKDPRGIKLRKEIDKL
ncbi:hypothetical protein ES695_03525 [Candidatus Atribacteria bacterium 1244-E10-H5-B2]|jgi:hypothetical protein|nr:MAG: hypothetical protein ES695_03525 [Candidatus Atribacteria bacterium 1244-E10-H5-B2]